MTTSQPQPPTYPTAEGGRISVIDAAERINAGGTRTNARVESVREWGTGSISVCVISKGRFSQVWFRPGTKADRIIATA